MCSSSPVRTPKLQLADEQPSTGKCQIPPKKKKNTPHPRAKDKHQQDGQEGAKSHLESNSLPSRDTQRAQTNLVCSRTQRPHRD